MHGFLEALRVQRWDDHRYYHHSRINQSLHLLSAISFVFAYLMMFKDPAIAALVGWLISMTTRQAGHFSLIRFAKGGGAAAAHQERLQASAVG